MVRKYFISLLMLVSFYSVSHTNSDEKAINTVLNSFHQAAAQAKIEPYFNLMSNDAIFLGTDASERWTKSEFREYAEPSFAKGVGWLYVPTQRNISLINNAQQAFFDELLDSNSYGVCRGTGVLIKTAQGWKIAQYNLSVPLPNGMAKGVIKQIQKYKGNE